MREQCDLYKYGPSQEPLTYVWHDGKMSVLDNIMRDELHKIKKIYTELKFVCINLSSMIF